MADFGLSRQASSDTVDTDTYGTVTHMPPELLMEGKLTKSADVYAFGVLLWEMYTGEDIKCCKTLCLGKQLNDRMTYLYLHSVMSGLSVQWHAL